MSGRGIIREIDYCIRVDAFYRAAHAMLNLLKAVVGVGPAAPIF